jgi:uncharacterized protein YjbI with pentapeptide repeats
MEFVAGMRPCEACGCWEPVRWQTTGSGSVWTVGARCPRCAGERAYVFQGAPALFEAQSPGGELGGAEPSRLVDACALAAEYERVAEEDTQLDRALVALVELAKFIPSGAVRVPGTEHEPRAEQYTRGWLAAELGRVRARAQEVAGREPRRPVLPPPRGTLDRDAIESHFKWVRRGKTGEGRLDVVAFDGRTLKLDGMDLSGARLEGVRLVRAVLGFIQLRDAELVDVDFTQAQLGSAKLAGAIVRGARFDGALLGLAELDRAHFARCSFASVWLDRSTWRDALVEDSSLRQAQFRDSVVDGARFVRCDLRSVDFRPKHPRIEATSRGTVFEHCDFREADFTGRDLAGATFLACRFGGAQGAPATTEGWTVEAADLSLAGDGSWSGGASDVLAHLGRARASDAGLGYR